MGRHKGVPNRRTREAQAIMQSLGLDPLESMIAIVQDNVPCSTCRGKGTTKYQPAKRSVGEVCGTCNGTGWNPLNTGILCVVCHGAGRFDWKTPKQDLKLLERTCESCYGSGKEKISPELKGKMLTELAQYLYPKRKAIEVTVDVGGTIAEAMQRAAARVKELK